MGLQRRKRRRVTAAMVALGVAVPLTATSANAAVDIEPPHAMEVLPGLDIVGLEGYDLEDSLTVEVWRDGIKVGSSGEPQQPGYVVPDEDEIDQPMGSILEINHDAGTCWAGHTPDIIAGDQIRVFAQGRPGFEFLDVADITVNHPQIEALDGDGEADDVVMTGRALGPDGLPMDAEVFAAGEAEIVQPAFRDVGAPGWDNGRVLGADVTGPVVDNGTDMFVDGDVGSLQYDEATGEWTATWKNLPVPPGNGTDAHRPTFAELAMDGEHVFMLPEGAGTEEGGGLAATVATPGDDSGGVQGCPAASSYGVKGSTPNHVNIATTEQDVMVISGTSYNANMVHLTVEDGVGGAQTYAVAPNDQALLGETTQPVEPVRQTWKAEVPMGDIESLDDGTLTASAVYDHVTETEGRRQATNPDGTPATNPDGTPLMETYYTHTVEKRTGTTHTFLKDLRAPGMPTANLPSGEYVGTQQIVLSAEDEVEETVRYRMGQGDVGEPTRGSNAAVGQITVSASQSVKARSFDRAGNPGPVLTLDYTITEPAPRDQLAPTPATLAPAPSAQQISVGRDVRAAFDEPVTNVTESTFQLRRAATGRVVRATVRYNPRTQTARLDPRRKLAPGRRYVALLRQGITDEAGNAVQTTRWSFRTDPAPRIRWRSPRPGATHVGRGRNVRIRVSENLRGVSRRTVLLRPAGERGRVRAAVRYRRGSDTVVVNPRRRLDRRTTYTVTLRRAVRDRDGHSIGRTRWRFRTR